MWQAMPSPPACALPHLTFPRNAFTQEQAHCHWVISMMSLKSSGLEARSAPEKEVCEELG